MHLPQSIRRLTPERLRQSNRARALALRSGLIPPRPMHSPGEAQLLVELSAGARRAVEVGVYEGSSAAVLARSLPAGSELHLIDPFGGVGPRDGWYGVEAASRRAVDRALPAAGGPTVHWHIARSADVAARWEGQVDLVFVDGDHTEDGCRTDWECWHPHVEPGGRIAFHDAREGKPGGWGIQGPTTVVDTLFRGPDTPQGWEIETEQDTIVVVRRAENPLVG
ncbi:MAG: class I SAM-dependent methyltransferase [Solirubrobacterales bacterium]